MSTAVMLETLMVALQGFSHKFEFLGSINSQRCVKKTLKILFHYCTWFLEVLYRTKCQVKQLRCGIIETKTCPLITTGEDAVEVVFLAKSVRGVCMHFVIICPHNFRPHAEDRAILDWTGSPPKVPQVNVWKRRFFKASSCSRTLTLPAEIPTTGDFSSTV